MTDFELSRASGKCSITGRPFEEDEEFFTVVLETGETLERRDVALDAWSGPPEGTLCFYKTRMPKRNAPKRKFIDDSAMVSFFKALTDTPHPNKQRFRFVLALILLRKRLLKYEKSVNENGAEVWEMRLVKEKTTHRVINPVLREDEIGTISAELGAILHGYAIDQLEAAEEPGTDAAPEGEAEQEVDGVNPDSPRIESDDALSPDAETAEVEKA